MNGPLPGRPVRRPVAPILDQIFTDLLPERVQKGAHPEPPTTHNERAATVDALEAGLDLLLYLTQALAETEDTIEMVEAVAATTQPVMLTIDGQTQPDPTRYVIASQPFDALLGVARALKLALARQSPGALNRDPGATSLVDRA